MARRRERGIYTFATPPGGQGALTGWYRTMLEQGRIETVIRSMRTQETMGFEPYLPFMETDLSPHSLLVCEILNDQPPGYVTKWMKAGINGYTMGMLERCERVYDQLGPEVIQRDYCPVAWASAQNPSRKEILGKVQHIVEVSGRMEVPIYYIAVSDESQRLYGVSMPVVWMRYSYLRTFRTGVDLINIYRLMGDRITDKYDIPAYREER